MILPRGRTVKSKKSGKIFELRESQAQSAQRHETLIKECNNNKSRFYTTNRG